MLSLNGVNAKEHAVFSELSRVKQYFAKVKEAESGGIQEKPNAKLDGAAANRFIKHALAGNDRFDRDRAERQTTEKANAEAKVEEPRSAPKKTAIGKDMSKKRKRSSALQQKDDASQSEDTTRPSAHPDQQLRTTVIGSLDSFQNNVVPRERKQTKKAKRERDKTETNDSSGQKPEKKSSKPPKDSKAALNDLLNRQGAANSKD